jgi:hypothetical protein
VHWISVVPLQFATHDPCTHEYPQPQAGLQPLSTQEPFTQVCPLGQVPVWQVPPQPSLPPHTVQVGVQQLFELQTWALVHWLHVPPQPSETPQEPAAQVGVQQLWSWQT